MNEVFERIEVESPEVVDVPTCFRGPGTTPQPFRIAMQNPQPMDYVSGEMLGEIEMQTITFMPVQREYRKWISFSEEEGTSYGRWVTFRTWDYYEESEIPHFQDGYHEQRVRERIDSVRLDRDIWEREYRGEFSAIDPVARYGSIDAVSILRDRYRRDSRIEELRRQMKSNNRFPHPHIPDQFDDKLFLLEE